MLDDSKNIIIYGCGDMGKAMLRQFHAERVKCYCDKNHAGETIHGVSVISMDELKTLPEKEKYKIFIAVQDKEARPEIKRELETAGYSFEAVDPLYEECMHVHGKYPSIHYDYSNDAPALWRLTLGTIPMLMDMFEKYADTFANVDVDFWLCFQDTVFRAEQIRQKLRIDRIMSYSTVYALRNRVIPMPDYKFMTGLNEKYLGDYQKNFDVCLKSGDQAITDTRAFWAGAAYNSESRVALCYLAEEYPDKLYCNKLEWDQFNKLAAGEMIPMQSFPKYKYLIDVRGVGWTDRVKYLLAMKRPLLLVDRPYSEFYFDDLIPMKHFVPVKEDFSDLIEKIDLLESNPKLYDDLVANSTAFVMEQFTKDRILDAVYQSVLRCQNWK